MEVNYRYIKTRELKKVYLQSYYDYIYHSSSIPNIGWSNPAFLNVSPSNVHKCELQIEPHLFGLCDWRTAVGKFRRWPIARLASVQ